MAKWCLLSQGGCLPPQRPVSIQRGASPSADRTNPEVPGVHPVLPGVHLEVPASLVLVSPFPGWCYPCTCYASPLPNTDSSFPRNVTSMDLFNGFYAHIEVSTFNTLGCNYNILTGISWIKGSIYFILLFQASVDNLI